MEIRQESFKDQVKSPSSGTRSTRLATVLLTKTSSSKTITSTETKEPFKEISKEGGDVVADKKEIRASTGNSLSGDPISNVATRQHSKTTPETSTVEYDLTDMVEPFQKLNIQNITNRFRQTLAVSFLSTRRSSMNGADEGSQSPSGPVKQKPKPKWVPDEDKMSCTLCHELFTTFNRKHHCRVCGSIVCGKCSNFTDLAAYGYKGRERVCDRCYNNLLNGITETAPTEEGEDTFGLTHSFERVLFSRGSITCNFCETLILEPNFYVCVVCNYTAHKKCVPRVPNTCSTFAREEDPYNSSSWSIQFDQKEVERLFQFWRDQDFPEGKVNSSLFAKFYHTCVKPEVPNFENTILGKIADNEIFRLFRVINRNNNGFISFEEYVLFLSQVKNPSPEDQIKLAFALYDEDSNGIITKQELTKALTKSASTNQLFGSVLEDHEFIEIIVETIFEAAGLKLDQALNIDAVMLAYQKDPSLLSKFCGY